jgi:hypothetical protein
VSYHLKKGEVVMKKLFLFGIIIIFVLFISSLNAQEKKLKFGVCLGPQLTLVNIDVQPLDIQPRIAMALGGIAEYPVSENFAFQVNLLYNAKGAKYEGEQSAYIYNVKYELLWKFNYLSIPILAKGSFGQSTKLFIYGGPELSFLLSAKQIYKIESNYPLIPDQDTETDVKDNMNSTEIAFCGGLGIEFPIQNMTAFIESRGTISLTEIFKENQMPGVAIGEGKVVNIIAALYLGILF